MADVTHLYYEFHGESRAGTAPLLLIHGGGSTIGTNWSAVLPSLTPSRLVIAVELQGHGHTPNSTRAYTFENSAEDVAALLTSLGLGPVDVLGFSNGGNVALRLAMAHPHLVRRQIVASAFFRRAGMVDGFWANMASADIRSMPDLYVEADRAINPDPAHQQQLFDLDTTQMRNFVDWPTDEFARMNVPTLYVCADRDVVRVEHVVEMAQLTPGARLLVLPATHGDFLGEALAAAGDPTAMQATIPWLLAFLDGTES